MKKSDKTARGQVRTRAQIVNLVREIVRLRKEDPRRYTAIMRKLAELEVREKK